MEHYLIPEKIDVYLIESTIKLLDHYAESLGNQFNRVKDNDVLKEYMKVIQITNRLLDAIGAEEHEKYID